MSTCYVRMRRGWKCTRPAHYGPTPCALVPKWWNVKGLIQTWGLRRL